MPQNQDDQIALFIRDEKTGRRAFNPKALKADSQPSRLTSCSFEPTLAAWAEAR
jgi:hypothetical protein